MIIKQSSTSFLTLAAACLGVGAALAQAQLTINEVFENPANGGDQTWEYIELVGPPGMNLSGYAVVLVKGGQDFNPEDGIPDGGSNQRGPEIDEAFSLDGWQIGSDGFFVLYNTESFGFTGLDPYLIPNPDYDFFLPESTTNKRFLNGASTAVLHIPSVDVAGNLSNDDSSTYLLLRHRPGHSLDANGLSVYGPGYAWKKDASPDVDFNSRLDFGDEDALGVPIYLADGLDGTQTGPLMMEPVQIVDEVAWSNNSGKEFATPGRGVNTNEISDSPRFNPDAISRVRYLTSNPLIGSRVNNAGELGLSSLADENWVYGETLNINPGTPTYLHYKPLLEAGIDATPGTLDDELNYLAPTDPMGPTYSYDGPGDDNPLLAPFLEFSPALDPQGSLLFSPYDIADFALTPGAYNDAPAGSPLAQTELGTQFRFIRGDLNFDGVVNLSDLSLAQSLLGADLDDQIPTINDRNTDDPSDDLVYDAWAYQVESFNTLLALIRMDLSDGTTGEWNSGKSATEVDITQVALLVPRCGDADLAAPLGVLNFFDISAFLAYYSAGDLRADLAEPHGVLNFFDISAFLGAYGAGCP